MTRKRAATQAQEVAELAVRKAAEATKRATVTTKGIAQKDEEAAKNAAAATKDAARWAGEATKDAADKALDAAPGKLRETSSRKRRVPTERCVD